MLFSFVIPAYNAAQYLNACVESIVNHPSVVRYAKKADSKHPYEIIIVNDGSSDGTFSVMQRLEERYPDTIRIFDQPNCGAGGARNQGLDMATGDYIIFADADDEFDPDVELPIDLLSTEKYEIVGIPLWCVFTDGKRGPYNHQSFPYGKHYDRSSDYLKNHNVVGSSMAYIWKRSMIERLHLRYLTRIAHEDELFVTQAFCGAGNLIFLSLHPYLYFIRPNSVMTSDTLQKRIHRVNSLIKVVTYMKQMSDEDDAVAKILHYKMSFVTLGLVGLIKRLPISAEEKTEMLDGLRQQGLYPLPWIWDVSYIFHRIKGI